MKSLDVVVLCKLFILQTAKHPAWTYASLSSDVCLSVGETHASVRRLKDARLYDEYTCTVIPAAMQEFLVHGVRYAFSAQIGGRERGIATAHSAPVFADEIFQTEDTQYVWPYAKGTERGLAVSPLSKGVPAAAIADMRLYEMLALLDGIRIGKAREVLVAIQALEKIIAGGS